MSRPTIRKNLPLAVMLASGLAAGNAFAQLEEVVVTAQKRTESLQDIPIAITAYDAENIEKMRLITAQDIGQASPNIQMPAYPFSNNNLALFIRGIGNADSIVLTNDHFLDTSLHAKIVAPILKIHSSGVRLKNGRFTITASDLTCRISSAERI